VDNGPHRIDWTASGREQGEGRADPISVSGRAGRLPANDNKMPWALRLKRVGLLVLAGCAAIWLTWTGLR
jgi:hypothetical protein